MLIKHLRLYRESPSEGFPSKGLLFPISASKREVRRQRGVAKETQKIQDHEEDHLLGYDLHLLERLCMLVDALIDLGVDSECTVC